MKPSNVPSASRSMLAERFRESVCVRCPGTMWGEKSICRVHNASIGRIEQCPEWETAAAGERTADTEMDKRSDAPSVDEETELKVYGELRDYSWSMREIRRLEESLAKMAGETGWIDPALVARYGIEAALPKAKGRKVGEPTPADRQLERTVQRLTVLKARTTALAAAAERLEDERERTLVDCLMAGERMNDISRHIGVSRQRLNEIRHSAVRKLAAMLYG